MYNIMRLPDVIKIGFTGENEFRPLQFDMRPWLELLPDGTPSIIHIRPGETKADAYIAATTFEDGVLTWYPSAGDIGTEEGYGEAQIWLEKTETGGTRRGKSAKVKTMVLDAVDEADPNTPAAQASWMEQMTELRTETITNAAAAAEDREAADDAITVWPRIGDNGNWIVWNVTEQRWDDTGVVAAGQDGATGPQGPQGIQGNPGRDGTSTAVVRVIAGEYGFSINEQGHLILTYSGGEAPDFYIDPETGHLMYDY